MTEREPIDAEIDALLQRGGRARPPLGLEARVLRAALAARTRRRRLLTFALAALVLGGAALALVGRPALEVASEKIEPHAVPADSAPRSKEPTEQPVCFAPVVALGASPLLDDFERVDAKVPERDGRSGSWLMITDLTENQPETFSVIPELLPTKERSPTNRRAIRVEQGLLREWGASLEYHFSPGFCYDASAYAGVRFRGRGPVRVKVAARQPEVMPTEYHGLCQADCYRSHQLAMHLDEQWRTYEVRWEQFRQRGYDGRGLDPRRLHSLQFHVESEDTPFEMWIDDVSFIEREK